MKIAIDISQIVYGTGVSQYTKNLVENLLRIDKTNEYLLLAGSLRRGGEIKSLFPSTKIFPIPPTVADILWNRLHILPVEKLIGEFDILHTSDWAEPPTHATKVTTVHDLYPLKFPKLISPIVREVHKRKLSWVFNESKLIIVPSTSTKKDLIELGIKEERIRIIPEAPSFGKSSMESVDLIRSKYNLKDNYLVAVGVTKLKNTERIIKAFHLARYGKDIKLVLVGNPVGVKVNSERNIRVLGHVPQNDLSAIYTGSKGLLFPSLYEGFGIPILDAFNCGVPVVTSNIGSMPEVAGSAAEMVDPYSVESITEGIEKILRGPKSYIEKGFKQVKSFSWQKTAQMTLDVYKEAIQ